MQNRRSSLSDLASGELEARLVQLFRRPVSVPDHSKLPPEEPQALVTVDDCGSLDFLTIQYASIEHVVESPNHSEAVHDAIRTHARRIFDSGPLATDARDKVREIRSALKATEYQQLRVYKTNKGGDAPNLTRRQQQTVYDTIRRTAELYRDTERHELIEESGLMRPVQEDLLLGYAEDALAAPFEHLLWIFALENAGLQAAELEHLYRASERERERSMASPELLDFIEDCIKRPEFTDSGNHDVQAVQARYQSPYGQNRILN